MIEDNPADIRLLRYALDLQGEAYELEVLRDGEQALRFVESQNAKATQPCVIVLDLHLPKHDGAAVLEAIRHTSELAYARVVVLASSASPEEEATVRKIGVDLYRDKPAGLDEFEQVAKEILAICKDQSLSAAV